MDRLRCNQCWKALPPDTNFYYNLNCKHTYCSVCHSKCVEQFSVECKKCKKKRNLDLDVPNNGIIQIKNHKNNRSDPFLLCGLNPTLIQQISQKALEFWDEQRVILLNFIQTSNNRNKQKALTYYNHIKQQKLKTQDIVNQYKNKMVKSAEFNKKVKENANKQIANMKSAALKYKNAASQYKKHYTKRMDDIKKLQSELNEKKRQYTVSQNNYTKLLKRHQKIVSNKQSTNNSVLSSRKSNHSNHSNHSNNSHRSHSPNRSHHSNNNNSHNTLGTSFDVISIPETSIINESVPTYGRHQRKNNLAVERYHPFNTQQPTTKTPLKSKRNRSSHSAVANTHSPRQHNQRTQQSRRHTTNNHFPSIPLKNASPVRSDFGGSVIGNSPNGKINSNQSIGGLSFISDISGVISNYPTIPPRSAGKSSSAKKSSNSSNNLFGFANSYSYF